MRIAKGLAGCIRKVNALAEPMPATLSACGSPLTQISFSPHVSSDGSLGRRDPQSLAQDAAKVRRPAAVPEEQPFAALKVIIAGLRIPVALTIPDEEIHQPD